MRILILPLLLSLGLPLSAQSLELGLFVGSQKFKEDSLTGLPFGSSWKAQVANKNILLVRGGYSVADIGPASFQFTLGYQPEVKSIETDTAYINANDIRTASMDYKNSHYSIGAMFNFKTFIAFGAGVEYRIEKLSSSYQWPDGTHSVNYGRPWVRANAGFSSSLPAIKPFIGLEVAFPLTSTSTNGDLNDYERDLKGVAPKLQVGVYGGVRF